MKYYLIQVRLGQLGVHLPVLGDASVHVLLQIHGEKLEYQIQLGLLRQNILTNI